METPEKIPAFHAFVELSIAEAHDLLEDLMRAIAHAENYNAYSYVCRPASEEYSSEVIEGRGLVRCGLIKVTLSINRPK